MTTHGNLEILVNTDEHSRRYGSRSRLFPMIFVNLFRNSATYAGTTPIVEVSFSMNSDEVVIVVSDDGPGIDPSIRDNLFEKGVAGTKGVGTGMGLYLIKQIIDIHNGTITLMDDDECTGCGFRITLPCASLTQLA
ncbi:MAG: HAMP domain-containing sensor histidine kinase [Candidatus Thorarchaeota archaeon]